MKKAIIVEISNRHDRFPFDESVLRKAVTMVVEASAFESAEISIALVDDVEMHELNVQYLDHDYPTDVLSFPLSNENDFLAGDIIVSLDTAEQQAQIHGVTHQQETVLYTIHGALHLVGYDDKEEEKRKLMREKESYFMEKMGLAISSPKRETTETD